MNKINDFSNGNNQFDEYIKIGIIGEYDVSPALRNQHGKYIEEYQSCFGAICDFTKDFENRDEAKAVVWCFVYATILERFKNPPSEVLQSIKDLIESENLGFQNSLAEIKKYEPVKHNCPNCNKVILIPPDYKVHNFYCCLKCLHNDWYRKRRY